MEGTAGVNGWPETQPGHFLYPRAQHLMIGEVNAAVAGLVAAGADEILVNDSHDGMRNLSPEEVHPAADVILGLPKRYSMVEAAAGHDLAVCTGYHAAAGMPGTLAHTMTGHLVEVRLNGRSTSETFWNAALLGQWGVPIGMVTGDDVLGAHIADILPWATFVTVKRAISLTAARSLSPERARAAIRAGAEEAVRRAEAGALSLFEVPAPYRLEIMFTEQERASRALVCPRSQAVDAYTVAYECGDFEEAYLAMRTLTRLGAD
jgi:D-amino peptidase